MGSTRDKVKRVFRKTVKWGGAGLTVLLVVVWIGSFWWQVGWSNQLGGALGVSAGRTFIVEPLLGNSNTQFSLFCEELDPPEFDWTIRWEAWAGGLIVGLPLWIPLLLSLLATAAAWRADAKYLRRARDGACAGCGYDRAGLAAGAVCPECGKQPEAR